jgi:transcriptional regulator with XRE-family HTH domain
MKRRRPAGSSPRPTAALGSQATPAFVADLPDLARRIRERSGKSRGQVARRLAVSPTVLYNLETGRTRCELGQFLRLLEAARIDAKAVIGRHLFSVTGLAALAPDEVVRAFRNRLQWSQAELARHLGYRSGSMVHHFEKGLRQPSLADFALLMTAAGDDLRGLVKELTEDAGFAARFPEGNAARSGDWREYWESFAVPAVRQLMRTTSYQQRPRYEPGMFSDVLGIDYAQERHALDVLKRLGLMRWHAGKPEIVPGARIIVPRDIPRVTLDAMKAQGVDFARRHYGQAKPEHALWSMDLLPVNAAIFEELKGRIRALQDEIHNTGLRSTDGFVYLGWLANYVPLR